MSGFLSRQTAPAPEGRSAEGPRARHFNAGAVRPGAAVLAEQGWASLKGRKVGLVTNQTGVLPDGTPTADAVARAEGVRLRALFGPEHGVRGDVPAGKYIASGKDPRTGLPVYSLYGRTKVPTAAMLSGVDTLVFDIQDIGSRTYTYLSTLGSVMEGAARHKVPLVVLDRPNPTGLLRVEGGPPRAGYFSFIGKYPLAYRHGLTLGEAAKMINGRGWLPGSMRCDLTVVPCANLTRTESSWKDFGGLPWVPTSPNVPYETTALFYAATGIAGELPTVSIGIGVEGQQFRLFGAPGVEPTDLVRELSQRPGLAHYKFGPAEWTPKKGVYAGRRCGGARIEDLDPAKAAVCRLNFEGLDALRKLDKGRRLFPSPDSSRMFDLSCGTDRVRKAFLAGANGSEMWAIFQEGADGFVSARRPYLIYA